MANTEQRMEIAEMKQAVRTKIHRFLEDFIFELTNDEEENLVSQF